MSVDERAVLEERLARSLAQADAGDLIDADEVLDNSSFVRVRRSQAPFMMYTIAQRSHRYASRIRSLFYAVTIDSEWMHNVAWDLALACLREDGRTFAIAVGTDTD